ncbi:MAG: hypothetical protein ACRD6X_04480, partial [Pyrinomonadaceae bacterium]
GDMRISVPKRECERARGRAHSGIALAYARASAMERGNSCPHSAFRIPHSMQARMPAFQSFSHCFVRASAVAGLCISSRSSVVKTPNRELTRG